MENVEFKTSAGYLVKVKPASNTCIVFNARNEPEVLAKRQTMEQTVPCVLFIGRGFDMVLPVGQYVLVTNNSQKLRLPYRLDGAPNARFVNLSCPSHSDEFPVKISHFETVKQFMSQEGEGHPFRYMVLDPDVARIDVVALRVKNQDAQILVIQRELGAKKKPQSRVNTEQVRANDLVQSGKAGEYTRNPVFLARIHLRNLELEHVKQLLLDFDMNAQEIEFIRTFLQIMIRNEFDKAELTEAKADLERINELYRLVAFLASNLLMEFDQEIEQLSDVPVAKDLAQYVGLLRKRATVKDEEIRLWEWEYRLKKTAGLES